LIAYLICKWYYFNRIELPPPIWM